MDTFVARQPIFDRVQGVAGYNLLFRSGPEDFFSALDVDRASSAVISDSLHVFSKHELTGGKPAFISVSGNTLLRGFPLLLPATTTVVQIRASVELDDDVIDACQSLRQAGYSIAADVRSSREAFDRLVPVIDVVRVDFPRVPRAELLSLTRRLAPRGIRFLADNIETRDAFESARTAGFDYFQGSFASRPEVIARRAVSPEQRTTLALIHELNRAELDRTAVADTIQHDPALALKLLRYLNSAFFALPTRVESIHHAISLLGDGPLRRWASLIAMGSLVKTPASELVVTSLVRARFCETVGPRLQAPQGGHELFLVGMMSTFDALLDIPIDQVVSMVSVSDQISGALLGADSSLSLVYQLALAIERGDWARTAMITASLQLDNADVARLYRDAIRWADQVTQF